MGGGLCGVPLRAVGLADHGPDLFLCRRAMNRQLGRGDVPPPRATSAGSCMGTLNTTSQEEAKGPKERKSSANEKKARQGTWDSAQREACESTEAPDPTSVEPGKFGSRANGMPPPHSSSHVPACSVYTGEAAARYSPVFTPGALSVKQGPRFPAMQANKALVRAGQET